MTLLRSIILRQAQDDKLSMKTFDRSKFRKRSVIPPKPRGIVLFFCGDGKGKTTAAIGIAIRAHGAGMKAVFIQFMKSTKWQSYERSALIKLGIPVHVLGSGFVGILDDDKPLQWHKAQARKALLFTKKLLRSRKYDVLLADEVVSAVEEGLLKQSDVLALIKAKPANTHLILTGHTAFPAIIKTCDLVTKMTNVKHPYYTEGRTAQRGIDF